MNTTLSSTSLEDVRKAIREKNINIILKVFFEQKYPVLKDGFKTENDLWDYKGFCPEAKKQNSDRWAEIAVDVLAFHNNKGGIVFFGITNSFQFCGAEVNIDSKMFNDQIRKFIGDKIWVQFNREFIQSDQRYLGVAIIPPRGQFIEKFMGEGKRRNGNIIFRPGDVAFRLGDTSKIMTGHEAIRLIYKEEMPQLASLYIKDEPFFRIFQPPYSTFIYREKYCDPIKEALKDKRTSICSLLGLGGVGKTALATWATIESYQERQFEFIVSTTAKDRELTKTGIIGLEARLTSFEDLLNNIADVFNMPDLKLEPIELREMEIRSLLENSNGLLYVDNLETVDDSRIIHFIDHLPFGCRALTTSRIVKVRISVNPIEIGPLDTDEIVHFIESISEERGYSFLKNLKEKEMIDIGNACHGIPLAIKWVCSRVDTAGELVDRIRNLRQFAKYREELLEFCFRRVFESLQDDDRKILLILSLFERGIGIETFVIGGNFTEVQIDESIDRLINSSLIQRYFDSNSNDYKYSSIPLSRAFLTSEVNKNKNYCEAVRKRLSDFYEASDVKDVAQRIVISDFRKGKRGTELELASLAKRTLRNGDIKSASDFYQKALLANPVNWVVLKEYAEFLRDYIKDTIQATQYFEEAAKHGPRVGRDKATIYREWGLLLRKLGTKDAIAFAIDKLQIAVNEDSDDVIAAHALANAYFKKGNTLKAIELLEPLKDHYKADIRVWRLLFDAYVANGDLIKAEQLRPKLA